MSEVFPLLPLCVGLRVYFFGHVNAATCCIIAFVAAVVSFRWSSSFRVIDLNGKSYRLLQDNLDKDIVPEESKILVKKDKVIVKLQKVCDSSRVRSSCGGGQSRQPPARQHARTLARTCPLT